MNAGLSCQRHPDALAGWACTQCDLTLCPDCVAVVPLNERADYDACVACGGLARRLTERRSTRSFPRALVDALRAPVGWLTASLLFGTFMALGVLPTELWQWLLPTLWLVLLATMQAALDDEEVELSGALVMATGRATFLSAPLLAFGWLPEPLQWLTLAVVAALLPAVAINLLVHESLLEVIHPRRLARVVSLGRDYLLAALITFGSLSLAVWWRNVSALASEDGLPPFAVALGVCSAASLFLLGRVLGALIVARGSELGLPPANGEVVPVLDAQPRGELPEPHGDPKTDSR